MTAVILAVDPGVHRLGLATCDLVTGEPVWCGARSIDDPSGGWRHQQIGAALSSAASGNEPAILAVEDPTHASRGKKQAAQWGGIMALVEAEARRRWPHIECWRISPPGWKKTIGLPGNCTADDYTRAAWSMGWGLPYSPTGNGDDRDAAAAACIATWAHLTNQRQEEAA